MIRSSPVQSFTIFAMFAAVGCSGADTKQPTAAQQSASRGPQVDGGKLQQGMRGLSEAIRDLNNVVEEIEIDADADGVADTKRKAARHKKQVLGLLQRIAVTAKNLHIDDATAEHRLVRERMPDFLREIAFARSMINNRHPDYVYARTVIGACTTCHESKPCPGDAGRRCLGIPE